MKKIIMCIFLCFLVPALFLIGCPKSNEKLLLNYAEKKYNKKFDVKYYQIGKNNYLPGRDPDILVLLSQEEYFSFRVTYNDDNNKEFTDDYINALLGTRIAKTISENHSNSFSNKIDIAASGYIYFNDVLNEENISDPIKLKNEDIDVSIIISCEEKPIDLEFYDYSISSYKHLFRTSRNLTLKIFCVKSEFFENAKMVLRKTPRSLIKEEDFEGELYYSFRFGTRSDYIITDDDIINAVIEY